MKDKLDQLLSIALKANPKAHKLAVENFCMSAPDDHVANAVNLINDSKSYKWNNHTVHAIRYVLMKMGKL